MKRWAITLSLFLSVVLFGCHSARQTASSPKAPTVVNVSIGRVHGGWTSHQFAIRRLSQEIKKSPNADIYIIRREVFFIGYAAEKPNLLTRYDRLTQTLYDDKYGKDSPYLWHKVTDKAIHAVASRKISAFDDFAKFGCVKAEPKRQ
ncbi:MAG TPA: hypothetical protein VF681_03560 [Abditibacteriaceae bacterium]|jgi:hypothetical protein